MTMIVFKALQPSDIENIYNIDRLCHINYWSINIISSYIKLKGSNILSIGLYDENKENIVGYFFAIVNYDTVDLNNIAVLPHYRNKGLAKKLMLYLFDIILEKGYQKLFLEVRKSNLNAINLYKRMMLEEYGIRYNYYNNPKEDAILFYINREKIDQFINNSL